MSTSSETTATDPEEFEEHNILEGGCSLYDHEVHNSDNDISLAQGSHHRLIQTLEYRTYHQEQELIEHYTDPERLEEPVPNDIGTQAGEDPNLTDLCLHIAYNRATAQISTLTLSEASVQPPLPTIVDNPEQSDQWREIQNLLPESAFNVSRASSHRSRSRTPAQLLSIHKSENMAPPEDQAAEAAAATATPEKVKELEDQVAALEAVKAALNDKITQSKAEKIAAPDKYDGTQTKLRA